MPLDIDNIPTEIIEARMRLIDKAVFFSVILYQQAKLVVLAPGETMWRGMEVKTACTDGKHIVINTDFFCALSIDERVFVLAHEIYHVLAMHPRRSKYYFNNGLFGYNYSGELANVAMDAVINQCLINDRIGTMPKMGVLFPNGIEDANGVTHTVTGLEKFEDVYEWLMRPDDDGDNGDDGDEYCEGDRGKGQEAINGQGGTGKAEMDVIEPDTQTDAETSETEMKAAVQSAAQQAKSRGQMPASMEQFVDDFLEPDVDWRAELRSNIVSRAEPDSYDWTRANRRKLMQGMIMPRRISTRCGHVVVAIDTSGSVSDLELRGFLGELSSILSETRPSALTVIWCDAQVDRVDELEEPEDLLTLVRAKGVPGRGGTRFDPPFEYAAEHIDDPAFFIYMTDGYAPFSGTEGVVDCPVIWVISNDSVVAPHGKTIALDISGKL